MIFRFSVAYTSKNEIFLYYCMPNELFSRVIERNCDFRFKEYEKFPFYILRYILNLKKWV